LHPNGAQTDMLPPILALNTLVASIVDWPDCPVSALPA